MTITGDKINALTLDSSFIFSSDESFKTFRRSFFVSQKISCPKTRRSRTSSPIAGKSTPIKNKSIFSQSLVSYNFVAGHCRQRPVFIAAAVFEATSCPTSRDEIKKTRLHNNSSPGAEINTLLAVVIF